MDDDLEDKIFYQTYISHVKLLSRFAVGLPSISTVWRLTRNVLLRPDVFCLCALFVCVVYYLQAIELWSRNMMQRIISSYGSARRINRSQLLDMRSLERHSWQQQNAESACYAVQGRRPKMEDRYVMDENLDNTNVALYAIFDGHGGDFAAEFACTQLIANIRAKINETMSAMRGITNGEDDRYGYGYGKRNSITGQSTDARRDSVTNASETLSAAASTATATAQRRSSLKKSFSTADDCGMNTSNCNREQDAFLDRLNAIIGNKGGSSFLKQEAQAKNGAGNAPSKSKTYDGRSYIEEGSVNFGRLLVDEVLAADDVLIEMLQKKALLAGTTALMALIHQKRLIVANVGDSRGVMCDWRHQAIPLSFDHKPQQVREKKRIQEAGGFISFKGVWRVAGVLATSRALGDYPLKQNKKLVIATPDILTFDLQDHRPKFLILASDGLWDTFSNEEAVAFIRSNLHEPLYGAKRLTHEAYQRGSTDNISVMVIVF